MRWPTPLLPALIAVLGLAPSPAQAEDWVVQITETEEWIDESDPRFYEEYPADDYLYAENLDYGATQSDGESAGRAITSFRANTPNALAAFGPFRVVDFTVDEQRGGMAHFTRGTDQHRHALDAFFARTGADYGRFNYLGEWHSHPSFRVEPSLTDAQSMLELVNGERGIDFAVLMVARLDYWISLKRSFTLFVRDGAPVPVMEART